MEHGQTIGPLPLGVPRQASIIGSCHKTSNGRENVSRLRHTYYEKEITTPLVFHSARAQSWRSKLVTLLEEMMRRLLNMDVYHFIEEKEKVLTHFLQKLADSGYTHPARVKIVKSATALVSKDVTKFDNPNFTGLC